MIAIESYKSIAGLNFGTHEADVIAKLGSPIRRSENREGELELHFTEFVLRFDSKTGDLRECTLLPRSEGTINGSAVSWTVDFLDWMHTIDQDLVEVLGFVVSLKLGIAVTGFHDDESSQLAIHAFRQGDWDMFQRRMKPYKI
jgi:hypothetical protein